jgi:hypothetical protein
MQVATYLRAQRQELEKHLAVEVAIQTRQMDIVKMIFELLRSEIEQIQSRKQQNNVQSVVINEMEGISNSSSSESNSSSDSDDSSYSSNDQMKPNHIFESSLIKFLPWCPSFRNPHFMNQDPRNLWSDEYLMTILKVHSLFFILILHLIFFSFLLIYFFLFFFCINFLFFFIVFSFVF